MSTPKGKRPVTYRSEYWLATSVLLISFALLLLTWQALEKRHQQRLNDYFLFETLRITHSVSERIALHAQALRGAAGLFAASQEVTVTEWRAFVEMLELDQYYPGMQGIGYALWIPGADLQAHLQSMHRKGYPNYEINPASPRDNYSSIIFLEPFSGRNLRAFGFDMYSEPTRRQAMERARDTGTLALTGKVTLVQETDANRQAGFLAYFPVYRNQAMPQTQEQRRTALLGWVYVPYRINDLISAIVDQELSSLRLEIFDTDQINEDGLLFDSQNQNTPPEFKAQEGAMSNLTRLEIGGHFWTLRYTALPHFSESTRFEAPWVEESVLALISILMFSITWAYTNARRRDRINQRLSESLRLSESRFRSLFEHSPVAYLAMNQRGILLDVNPQVCDLLGYQDGELVGKSFLELIAEDTRPHFEAKLQTLSYYGVLEYELTLIRGTGNCITVILDGRLQRSKNSNNILHCILINITERKMNEENLRLAARVFSEAHEGITITDAKGTIIDANPTFCAITGYSRDEVIGQNHKLLQSGKHDQAFYAELWRTLVTEGVWQGEIWNRKKGGELYVELLTISALRNPNGEIVNYVGLFSDITQSKLQQQALEELAHLDPLTRLPNRILFRDRFQQAIAHCKRESGLLAVAYLDLDGFKQINDSMGHEAGDRLLIEVAERITQQLRSQDTLSRLGGDEFALLMNDIPSKLHCEQALQRILKRVAEPYQIRNQTLQISVSIGITLYPLDTSNEETLLSHADQAMYQAKQQGRNRLVFFDPFVSETGNESTV